MRLVNAGLNQSLSSIRGYYNLFLKNVDHRYKGTLVAFLIMNPVIFWVFGPYIAATAILAQGILFIGLSLVHGPQAPLIVLVGEALLLGLVTDVDVLRELNNNIEIVLMVLFVVAAVGQLKTLLMDIFIFILLRVKSKRNLAVAFSVSAAVCSAFLDALTVVAIMVTISSGFLQTYLDVTSVELQKHKPQFVEDIKERLEHHADVVQFKSFLVSIVIHAAVGTMLGGIWTKIGEPQNLLIANLMGWDFIQFLVRMIWVSAPVAIVGFCLSFLLELGGPSINMLLKKLGKSIGKDIGQFCYGVEMPEDVRRVLTENRHKEQTNRTDDERKMVRVELFFLVIFLIGLITHIFPVWITGAIVFACLGLFKGLKTDHKIHEALEDSTPFVVLLIAFFALVGMIHAQHLFQPVTDVVLSYTGVDRLYAYYLATGALSVVSDNVFVAMVYITDALELHRKGVISREELELIAVAINAGTNVLSIGTPNGQAAFLFLLMSCLKEELRLGYMKIFWHTLPYFMILTPVGFFGIWLSATMA